MGVEAPGAHDDGGAVRPARWTTPRSTGLVLPRRRRPTIKDIAAAAGVSRSAASRALRDEGYVGEGARQRVLEAAAELGYVPHVTARSLKDRVTRCVGVVCLDVRDPVQSGLVAGVCAAATPHGLVTVVVDLAGRDVDAEEGLRDLVALGVAGVVLVPATQGRVQYLQRYAIPVVQVGGPEVGGPGPGGPELRGPGVRGPEVRGPEAGAAEVADAPTVGCDDVVVLSAEPTGDLGVRVGHESVALLVRRLTSPDAPRARVQVPVQPPQAAGF